MRPVWTALLVYLVAVVTVLGLQLAAVTALVGWRGSIEVERDAPGTPLAGGPPPAPAPTRLAVAPVRHRVRGRRPSVEPHPAPPPREDRRPRPRDRGARYPRAQPGARVPHHPPRGGTGARTGLDRADHGRRAAARRAARGAGGRPAGPDRRGAVLARLPADAAPAGMEPRPGRRGHPAGDRGG